MRFRIIFQSLNTLSQKQKEATEKVTIGIPQIESEPNSLLSSELVLCIFVFTCTFEQQTEHLNKFILTANKSATSYSWVGLSN